MNRPLRILLIDDNPGDRALVVRELRREFPDLRVEQIIDMEDVTERGRTEKALREMERVQVLAATAGAAAHEINQPLTVLMALTEIMLIQAAPDAPQRRNLEALYRAAGRISEIVRNMEGVRKYATKPYAGGIEIVDFDAAAGVQEERRE